MKSIINRKGSKKVTSNFRRRNGPVRRESGMKTIIAADNSPADYGKKEGGVNGEIRTDKS